MPAPLGHPAMLLRKGAESFDAIIGGLRGVDVLARQN